MPNSTIIPYNIDLYFGTGEPTCPVCHKETCEYDYTTRKKTPSDNDIDIYKCQCGVIFECVASLNFWELDSYY